MSHDNRAGLVGTRFLYKYLDLYHNAIVSKHFPRTDTFQISLGDGDTVTKIHTYNELHRLIKLCPHNSTEQNLSLDTPYMYDKIIGHKTTARKVLVHVKWCPPYSTSWEPISWFAEQDPTYLSQYAFENNLLGDPGWKHLIRYLDPSVSRVFNLPAKEEIRDFAAVFTLHRCLTVTVAMFPVCSIGTINRMMPRVPIRDVMVQDDEWYSSVGIKTICRMKDVNSRSDPLYCFCLRPFASPHFPGGDPVCVLQNGSFQIASADGSCVDLEEYCRAFLERWNSIVGVNLMYVDKICRIQRSEFHFDTSLRQRIDSMLDQHDVARYMAAQLCLPSEDGLLKYIDNNHLLSTYFSSLRSGKRYIRGTVISD